MLRIGLRLPTALCLALVIAGLAFESALMIALLVPIGAMAGWTARHPFDLMWNHGLRHLVRAPELPPNPTRRRHAFKLATVWLAGIAALFAVGAATVALILGGVLVAVCSLVTVTNFCIRRRCSPRSTRGGDERQSHDGHQGGLTANARARSKRILFAWIARDIAWAVLFIDARKRHEKRLGLR